VPSSAWWAAEILAVVEAAGLPEATILRDAYAILLDRNA
jgi:hypothetical protein